MSEQKGRPALSVVVPVYNERATIEELLRRVQAVEIEKEIIVVDDGSTDGTREFLEALVRIPQESRAAPALAQAGCPPRTNTIRVLFQDRNRGKGAAVRRGIKEAQGKIILVQDADLEYDPRDYHRLLEPTERDMADVVYGSRFLGGSHRGLFFWHSVGNKVLTTLSNVFTGLNLSDVWTCYKVFRREVVQGMDLREDGFGFEPEVTAKVAKGRWRVFEVPISYWGRTYAEGKKITWKAGIRAIYCILRYNLFR